MSGHAEYSHGETQSNQNVFGPQSSALQNLYSMAGRLAGTNTNAMGTNVLNSAMPSFESLLNPTGNSALTGAIDASAGDVTRNLTRGILPAIRDTAVGGGGLGGSRGALAAGVAGGDAAREIAATSATMRGAAYEGDQGRMLQAVGLAPGLSMAGTENAWAPLLQYARTLGPATVLGQSTGRTQSKGAGGGMIGGGG